MPRKLTREAFIEKARKIHGNKYDYSKVFYINSKTSVIIICPIHGEFLQRPNNHLLGQGCPKCKAEKSARRSTREDFIEKARKIHGDKYDYSKVVYINNSTPVIIICPEHGEFLQTPCSHLYGSGCSKCRYIHKKPSKNKRIHGKKNKTYITQSFIEEAKKIHSDKYGYSKAIYVNMRTPVIITCPKHGEFLQTPETHLSGHGCAKCGREKSNRAKALTQDKFIYRSTIIHNGKYDYSKVVYINNSTLVKIICPEHGEFLQTPKTHLRGQGCPICKNNLIGKKLSSSTKEFIEKARKIHGDKYGYSKVVYINNSTPVIIICPEHGEFLQTPQAHLSGHGCAKCRNEKLSMERRDSLDEFIRKANEVHFNRYSYYKVNYTNSGEPILITCSIHGDFWQTPEVHLRGSGCPKCRQSHLENLCMEKLEKNEIKYEVQKKFPWLRNVLNMKIDFYLPDYNIGIECQGEQHIIRHSHKLIEDYDSIIKRDCLKNLQCMNNGVILYYFFNPIYKECLERGEIMEEVKELYTKDNSFFEMDKLIAKIKESE